ncbi:MULTISPECIES: 50S ribosomal protein L24 [Stappiaceae]|jgi:large subunit ribosomal protein L24|uniref:Large ribosomal subunit protein uL24 n=3 Tax=Roseibium TaxID=150830 RepID=A0A0M6XXW1_9HYPH|nr:MULTISPECIES: 50S ribosomal protein L24 [Stappiaceae]MCR9282729.1 50S ribosomal protein L24 [Paracoccaceae bacterium]MEC9401222.1 50S ribosomal protein L24 [Pseudomonadota bacterium]MEE4011340.1 50S ribosomal protein L24 [Roseibium sp. FZY0029]AMN53165.1 50S ribosomal protein L24 [Labrenzia sp. CP4]AQQ06378.1 50S ribosomal protein L24 [Roseibium aggregatum]
MAAKIKKGDTVVVLTGRDKGKSGEVIQMLPADNKALVRGINMVRRHQKQTQTQEAGIVAKEAPIHLSNVALADPKDGKATRVGFKVQDDGTKVRVAKRSGDLIDG